MSRPPAAAEYLATNRGGGLFTESVNQRLAAHFCVLAYRLGLAPTILTLGNLVFGLAASVGVIAFAPYMAAGEVPAWAVGLGALALWQLAYTLDCADGQLARATGQASAAGKRVDILADVTLQIALVTAVGTVAAAYTPRLPYWLAAAFAGTWMVNLVTSALQQGESAASLINGSSVPVRVLKLVRDYGAVVTVIGLALAIVPQWMVWFMVAFTMINGVFLLASVAASARASLWRA